MDTILHNRNPEIIYQFLMLISGEPQYDAKWQHKSYLVDTDRAVTDLWLKYIQKHDIPPLLHGQLED